MEVLRKERLPVIKRITYGTLIGLFKYVLMGPLLSVRSLRHWLSPPDTSPCAVKTYACRRDLPIR
jgi:hypothetical protein